VESFRRERSGKRVAIHPSYPCTFPNRSRPQIFHKHRGELLGRRFGIDIPKQGSVWHISMLNPFSSNNSLQIHNLFMMER
jgi:hypothetical protein